MIAYLSSLCLLDGGRVIDEGKVMLGGRVRGVDGVGGVVLGCSTQALISTFKKAHISGLLNGSSLSATTPLIGGTI